MGLLQNASNWLQDVHKASCANLVDYSGGNGLTIASQIPARIGKTEFVKEVDGSMLLDYESRDFLIEKADLTQFGNPYTPTRGNVIQETQGGQTFNYRVAAPEGQPVAKDDDRFKKTWRIHTVLIGQQ